MKNTAAIILAAGQGTRMKSALPKVLHTIAGRPLIQFPAALALELEMDAVVAVLGHGKELVARALAELPGGAAIAVAHQLAQLGTGDAVASGMTLLADHHGAVFILSGDVPLLTKDLLLKLHSAYQQSTAPLAFVTFTPNSSAGYGRVLRVDGRVVGVREERDCSLTEREIGEVNAGIYLADADFLRQGLGGLSTANAQHEIYLTDLIAQAAAWGAVATCEAPTEMVQGVNDRLDLARVEAVALDRILANWMRRGVTIRRPETVRIEAAVELAEDCEIHPGVQLLGHTRIARGCRIETGAVLTDATLAEGAVIKPYSIIDSAIVGKGAEIGPMGRLRKGTDIRDGAKVGNFVELKNTILGPGSKASHLSYLGDGDIGAGVNIGAGTIFCNYDGFQKHRTVLEDGVFIGSDSQLVAPVTVGRDAYVGSGSTITYDVPADALALSRCPQSNKEGLAIELRRRFSAQKAAAAGKKEMEKS